MKTDFFETGGLLQGWLIFGLERVSRRYACMGGDVEGWFGSASFQLCISMLYARQGGVVDGQSVAHHSSFRPTRSCIVLSKSCVYGFLSLLQPCITRTLFLLLQEDSPHLLSLIHI